jgi:hypothetical protein
VASENQMWEVGIRNNLVPTFRERRLRKSVELMLDSNHLIDHIDLLSAPSCSWQWFSRYSAGRQLNMQIGVLN